MGGGRGLEEVPWHEEPADVWSSQMKMEPVGLEDMLCAGSVCLFPAVALRAAELRKLSLPLQALHSWCLGLVPKKSPAAPSVPHAPVSQAGHSDGQVALGQGHCALMALLSLSCSPSSEVLACGCCCWLWLPAAQDVTKIETKLRFWVFCP